MSILCGEKEFIWVKYKKVCYNLMISVDFCVLFDDGFFFNNKWYVV